MDGLFGVKTGGGGGDDGGGGVLHVCWPSF